jgi:hypothetical protein
MEAILYSLTLLRMSPKKSLPPCSKAVLKLLSQALLASIRRGQRIIKSVDTGLRVS